MDTSHPQARRAAKARGLDHGDRSELQPRLRSGTTHDLPELVAMHARCSAETVRRRYHCSLPRLSPRLALGLLRPQRGWSVVATCGEDLVGIALYSADRNGAYDVGLLVEDRWQRHGVGTGLLRVLARHARLHGISGLTCTTQPDNPCLPRTIRRAGFVPRLSVVDGLVEARFSVNDALEQQHGRANRLPLSETTQQLVPLLNTREELRQIHPVAHMIDQAVRGGA